MTVGVQTRTVQLTTLEEQTLREAQRLLRVLSGIERAYATNDKVTHLSLLEGLDPYEVRDVEGQVDDMVRLFHNSPVKVSP